MKYHLVCVHPFDSYIRGQKITDQDEVERHLNDREHHFVRVPAPEEEAPAVAAPAPVVLPKSPFVAS